MAPPVFGQLNLVARDIEASVAFYRALGLPIEGQPGDPHRSLQLPNGVSLEWDGADSVGLWDSGWKGSGGDGRGRVLVGFDLASPADVDDKYAELTAAGYVGHQPPYDAFWGARYAIVEDPDGTCVGLMSPIEKDRKYWPPVPPPTA